jgi:hypothetical protein
MIENSIIYKCDVGQALCVDVLEECYLILSSLRESSEEADETNSDELVLTAN